MSETGWYRVGTKTKQCPYEAGQTVYWIATTTTDYDKCPTCGGNRVIKRTWEPVEYHVLGVSFGSVGYLVYVQRSQWVQEHFAETSADDWFIDYDWAVAEAERRNAKSAAEIAEGGEA